MALLPNAAAMAPVASTIPEKLPPLPPEAPLLDSSSINMLNGWTRTMKQSLRKDETCAQGIDWS